MDKPTTKTSVTHKLFAILDNPHTIVYLGGPELLAPGLEFPIDGRFIKVYEGDLVVNNGHGSDYAIPAGKFHLERRTYTTVSTTTVTTELL